MQDTSRSTIENLIANQRSFFATHQTKDIAFRLTQLKKFKAVIQQYETQIAEALWLDLHKSFEEAYLTEISMVVQELDNHIRHLKQWSKPKRVPTPLHLIPSTSRIYYEPLGVSLIVAPWNYPFQLLLNPLVGAISAGCTALLKPSPYTPHIALLMEKMLGEIFNPNYVAFAQGGREVNQILLEQRYDLIFFTGSPMLGKIVMKAAAEHLTPVVLELGGKSPCIVDENADIKIAARRIAWGKCINAGQTCIAPDYLLIHRKVKDEFLKQIPLEIASLYGADIKTSQFFPRIVNDQAVQRLQKLMQHGTIVYGGEVDASQKFIEPTLIDAVQPDFPIMQEEIFGPILPIITYDTLSEALAFVQAQEKPLAFYYFGQNDTAKEVLRQTTSGGGCINDTLMHIANHHMPFGGVGNSGMNKYHGKESFVAFSNARAITFAATWIDLPLKYPPFTYFKWVKKIV